MSKKAKIILAGVVGTFIAVVLITLAVFLWNPKSILTTGEPLKKAEQPISLKISCVGDIMVHSPQIPAQYNAASGDYDFTDNFQYVRPYIEDADLAMCNLETIFAGGPKYEGYPKFNTPDSLAYAIKEAGWDMALTANNHMLDQGIGGLQRTLEVASAAGLSTSGTHFADERKYTLQDVKGVKVAVISYTYETMEPNGQRTLNGNPIPLGAEPVVNSFDYKFLDNDLKKIFGTIASAREDGVDIVVCYFHWGTEYEELPNEIQKKIARGVANAGADIIFASHPHVLQSIEMLEVQGTKKTVPVFYSMGNFISNQRYETVNNNRYTEQGIIAEVELEYMKSTKAILTVKADAVPLWVDKYWYNGKNNYTVLPLCGEFETYEVFKNSGHLNKAEQALSDITQKIGKEYLKGN